MTSRGRRRRRSRGRTGRPARRGVVLAVDAATRSSRRDQLPRSNSIFNSAVVPFDDGFAGVFRVDDTARTMNLHAGRSRDGVAWEIDPEPIGFRAADGRVRGDPGDLRARLRPAGHLARGPLLRHLVQRLPRADDRRRAGRTTSRRSTSSTTRSCRSTATACSSRAGSAAPTRCSAGRATTGTRRSATSSTRRAPTSSTGAATATSWRRGRLSWESTKIGAGPTPIETDEGWLLIYHGVLTSCNGFVYSMGAALLDLDEPWRVLARRARLPALAAGAVRAGRRRAERRLPVRGARRREGDRLTVYYGGADTVICMAHGHLSELRAFLRTRAERGGPSGGRAPGPRDDAGARAAPGRSDEPADPRRAPPRASRSSSRSTSGRGPGPTARRRCPGTAATCSSVSSRSTNASSSRPVEVIRGKA